MSNPNHETFTDYQRVDPEEYERDFNHTKAQQRIAGILSTGPEKSESKVAKEEKFLIIEKLTSDFSNTITRELLSNFITMDILRDFQELSSLGKSLITVAGEKTVPELSVEIVNYFQRVNAILVEVELDEESIQKVHDISASCVKKVLSLVEGNASVDTVPHDNSAYQNLLQGVSWQEHFKKNPPPKYEGVKKSGKALVFFLELYRGKPARLEDHRTNLVDYVSLGLTQADLRHYDPKLLRALLNADQYKNGIDLNNILPPIFTKNPSSLHI